MAKVSIRDVAGHAGVSTATVSHVINNTRFVKPETRELVLKSIEKLHYSPNATARSFKTGKRNLIAFIVPDISNAFFATLIEEVETVISKEGFKLLVINTKETKEREIDNLRLLTSGLVDGIILASTLENYSEISAVVPRDLPVILVDRNLPGAPYDSVTVANYMAVHNSVEYLIRKGHKKIGFFTGLPRISTTAERLEAYCAAMEKHNLYSDSLICAGTSMTALVSENLDKLLSRGCTALVISNNIMAIEAMMLLNQKGLRDRKYIELVGYKDSEQAQYGLQHMNLIQQPVVQLGRAAGKQLLERLKHPELPVQKILLQAEFQPLQQKDEIASILSENE